MERIAIGYKALITLLNLAEIPHYCWSYIVTPGKKQTLLENNQEIQLFPKSYSLTNPQNPFAHLEFALKYEGVNLPLIKAIFTHLGPESLENYIQAAPLGKTERKLWYIYELLFSTQLNIPDLTTGNYTDLLSPENYYTSTPIKSKRHKINDNLLGNAHFCPFVRKTPLLKDFEDKQLDKETVKILSSYDPYTIRRAIRYLYAAETVSTWQIEREIPSKEKEARFINALQKASEIKHLTKQELIILQSIILDERHAAKDYRTNQIFVGRMDRFFRPEVHYIPPAPQDIPLLMSGLLQSLTRMMESEIHPVIIAAAISFGFVFIHPFEDGNGRIHRFLIHYILTQKKFTPHDAIFPISAAFLTHFNEYRATLESYSKNIMQIINYDIIDTHITLQGDLYAYYAYADYTPCAEYLFASIEQTIAEDFTKELMFIANYDTVKKAIQNIVDIPDRDIELLVKCIIQNKGILSTTKKENLFPSLTNQEIKEIESAIATIFKL